MNHSKSYYRYQRARHKKRDKCYKKQHSHKNVKDVSREEAMNESEKYYQTYGYEFENYSFTDAEWHWIQVEEWWYYEDGFYHDWLVDHPDGSTD